METKFIALLKFSSLAAAITLGVAAPSRAATVISLDPVSQNIGVGGTAFVNLNITGMNAAAAPSLGGWLTEISYNGAVVSASAVSFGSHLVLGVWDSLQIADFTTPGIAMALETSLEDLLALDAVQPDSFTLATFSFTGVAPGVSSLTFSRLELSDEQGFPMDNYAVNTASITVGTPSVPDTGSLLAPLAACLGLILFGHHWRTRKAAA